MNMHWYLYINKCEINMVLFWFCLDENLVPCPCNSPKSCFSFDNNGAEMCGCFPGYVRQIDSQSGNETCTGMLLPHNLVIQ